MNSFPGTAGAKAGRSQNNATNVRPIPLLPMLKLPEHARQGTVSLVKDKLVFESISSVNLVDFPFILPTDFDLYATVTRLKSKSGDNASGDGFGIGIHVDHHPCLFAIDHFPEKGFLTGPRQFGSDLDSSRRKDVFKGKVLQDGEPTRLLLQVRRQGIRMFADKKQIYEFIGSPAKFKPAPHLMPGTRNLFQLSLMSWKSRFQIEDIQLVPKGPFAEDNSWMVKSRVDNAEVLGAPVDLLSKFKAEFVFTEPVMKDAQGILLGPQMRLAGFRLPMEMTPEYNLQLNVIAKGSEGMIVGLPVVDQNAMLVIDREKMVTGSRKHHTALELISGKSMDDPMHVGLLSRKLLSRGEVSQLEIRVRYDSVRLYVDGEFSYGWSGSRSQLSLPAWKGLQIRRSENCLRFLCMNDAVIIKSMSYRPVVSSQRLPQDFKQLLARVKQIHPKRDNSASASKNRKANTQKNRMNDELAKTGKNSGGNRYPARQRNRKAPTRENCIKVLNSLFKRLSKDQKADARESNIVFSFPNVAVPILLEWSQDKSRTAIDRALAINFLRRIFEYQSVGEQSRARILNAFAKIYTEDSLPSLVRMEVLYGLVWHEPEFDPREMNKHLDAFVKSIAPGVPKILCRDAMFSAPKVDALLATLPHVIRQTQSRDANYAGFSLVFLKQYVDSDAVAAASDKFISIAKDSKSKNQKPAIELIAAIEKRSKQVVPALYEIIEDANSGRAGDWAAFNLAEVIHRDGLEADRLVKFLVDQLKSNQFSERQETLFMTLRKLGSKSVSALKDVAKMLDDKRNRIQALETLATWQASSRSTVPKILNGLDRWESPEIEVALNALSRIGYGAEGLVKKTPKLIKDPVLRKATFRALASFGDKAAGALPLVVEYVRSGPDWTEEDLEYALLLIGSMKVSGQNHLGLLKEFVNSSESRFTESVKESAKTAIENLERAAGRDCHDCR